MFSMAVAIVAGTLYVVWSIQDLVEKGWRSEVLWLNIILLLIPVGGWKALLLLIGGILGY